MGDVDVTLTALLSDNAPVISPRLSGHKLDFACPKFAEKTLAAIPIPLAIPSSTSCSRNARENETLEDGVLTCEVSQDGPVWLVPPHAKHGSLCEDPQHHDQPTKAHVRRHGGGSDHPKQGSWGYA